MRNIINFFKGKKLFIYIFIFFLFFIDFITINNFIMDNYWNYGFAYNIVKGMVPYRDFNMVLFPLSSLIMAFIMKIFGSKLIVYYLFYSLIGTLIIYLIDKKRHHSTSIIILFFLLLYETGGYNYISLLLLFLIIYFEERKSNDYLIGLLLGLSIINNQKMFLLVIPTLLSFDKQKIIKRIEGILIPCQLIILYLFMNKALYYFIDYTILGIFDFGNNNSNITIYLVIEIILVVYLIYLYFKEKDKTILYIICFQIMSIPIFDAYHVATSSIPAIYYICNSKGNVYTFIRNIFSLLIIFCFVLQLTIMCKNDRISINLDYHNNYFLTIKCHRLEWGSNILYEYYSSNKDDREVYFFTGDSYFYKLKFDIPINKFDLVNYGNNGYHGTEKLISDINSKRGALFIVYDPPYSDIYYQVDDKVIKYIKDNYRYVEDLSNYYYVYEIVD